MGKRGPKPKPTALRRLEGDPGRKGINELEPSCEMPPVMPDAVGMDALASAEWKRLASVCPPNLFTAMDTGTLTTYCLAWSMLVKAQADLDENGIMVKLYQPDDKGVMHVTDVKTNPSARLWKAATETLLKTVDRLGLAPTARVRIQLPSRDAKPASKFAGMLGRN